MSRMKFYIVSVASPNPGAGSTTSSRKLVGLTTADIQTVQSASGEMSIFITQQNIPGALSLNSANRGEFGAYAVPVVLDSTTGKYLALVDDAFGGSFQFEVPEPAPAQPKPLFDGSVVFEFYVDPQQVTPTFKKNITPILTRGGYEVQHWGNALSSLRVEAVTGSLLTADRVTKKALAPGTPITQSPAYQALKKLRRLYFDDHANRPDSQPELLGLSYYDMFWIGYFEEFSGPVADAKNPYLMTFAFTFTTQQIIDV